MGAARATSGAFGDARGAGIAWAAHSPGLALLVLDARGHGLSSAVDFQFLPRFAQDVEAGLAWLRQQPQVDALRLAEACGAGAEACLAVPGGHDLTQGLGPDHVQRMMSFLRASLALPPR